MKWADDFLASRPDLAVLPFERNRGGFTFFNLDGSKTSICATMPAHYEETPGNWQPIDTQMVDDGTYIGGKGCAARIRKADGAVLDRNGRTQRATRLVRYRPSNGSISQVSLVPTSGVITGEDAWSRTWGDITYTVKIGEIGTKETLSLGSAPSIPGTKPDDYIMVEEHIPDLTLPDGWLDLDVVWDGKYYPLPTATAANNAVVPVRRLIRSDAQGKWVLTGALVSDLQPPGIYPLEIDPSYYDDTADGYVRGHSTASQATARATATSHDVTTNYALIGTYYFDDGKGSYVWQYNRIFLKFLTSGIPDGDTVTAVTMTATSYKSYSVTTDFDYVIQKCDWSAYDPITSGNRDSAYDACLSASPDDNILVNTASISRDTPFTSGALNTAWINKTGSTYYALWSDVDRDNDALSTNWSYQDMWMQEYTTSAHRPYLSVTHSSGGGYTGTPGNASVTITAQTPTATATTNYAGTPGNASVTLTAQTPTAVVDTPLTPGPADVSLWAFACWPLVSSWYTYPGPGSLTFTAQTPTVVNSGDTYSGTPGNASVTITAQTPTVVNSSTTYDGTPGNATVVITAQTPTVAAPWAGTPGAASVSITAQTPTAVLDTPLTPGNASVVITAQTPTVVAAWAGTVGAATVVLTAFAPTVSTPPAGGYPVRTQPPAPRRGGPGAPAARLHRMTPPGIHSR